jgi:hypothetical protein
MTVKIGGRAPNLKISEWVQGIPTNIENEKGNVIVVEVFQVNCPGCFIYGIPEAIDIYTKFAGKDVKVLGLATAFEDFDKNTLENLKLLLTDGQVIGETQASLQQYGRLKEGDRLSYRIPFPVAMDLLIKENDALTESKILDFVESDVPDFRTYNESERKLLLLKVRQYLQAKHYSARTFEEYGLRGTPSSVVIDRKGLLRQVSFGADGSLHSTIENLLSESE